MQSLTAGDHAKLVEASRSLELEPRSLLPDESALESALHAPSPTHLHLLLPRPEPGVPARWERLGGEPGCAVAGASRTRLHRPWWIDDEMPAVPVVRPFSPINPRHAAVFVRVVETGGFTAAARSLAAPNSAISAAVASLESALGVRLLHRTSRMVSPTDAGRAFYAQASIGLAALDSAAAAAINSQHELRGPIRLSAPVETGTFLLEPLVSAFLMRHPEVTVDVLLTPRAVDLVAEGVDLALRGGPIHDPSLVGRPVGSADAGVFAAPEFFVRRALPSCVEQLSGLDAVLHGAQTTTWTLVGSDGVASVEVRGRLRVDHFAFAREAVARGLGLGLFPVLLCERQVRDGALIRVLPEAAVRGTRFHLVHVAGRFLPTRVAALRDALVAGLAEGPLVQAQADHGQRVSPSSV